MAVRASQVRSLYRRLLRELPSRSPSILANPSPVQQHIRADFTAADDSAPAEDQQWNPYQRRLNEGEQYLHYLKAQRMYTTLVERYNPGMNMSEEEKVRLTARRVGMDIPIEFLKGGSGSGSGEK